MWKDWFQYIKHFIKSPSHMGSVAPSSKYLANAIVNMLPERGKTLLELGPGTGAITKALVNSQRFEHLIALEHNPQFIPILHKNFPDIDIIHGDAFDLTNVIEKYDIHGLEAIVSSLPLLMFSLHDRKQLAHTLLSNLPTGQPLLQFSYGKQSPIPLSWLEDFADHFDVDCQKVLLNVPPARVWRYRLLT